MGEKIGRFHSANEPNRMPHEVKEILMSKGSPAVDDVRNFSLDDMIMYIINYLDEPDMHQNANPPYDAYTHAIAKECAYSLGEWFWTIFTAPKVEHTSRCTRRIPPY